MVDHNNRITIAKQIIHHTQQAFDIGRMETDRRLIEHIEHPGRTTSHRTSEGHALTLSIGKRCARTVEAQIPKSQLLQTLDRLLCLSNDRACHRLHIFRQACGNRRQPPAQFIKRERCCFGQVLPIEQRRTRTLRKTRATAIGAGLLLQELGNACKAFVILHFRKRILHRVHRTVIREIELGGMVLVLRHIDNMLLFHRAMQNDILLLRSQLTIRNIDAHTHFLRDLRHERPYELTPRCNRPFFKRKFRVCDKGAFIHLTHHARSTTRWASARAVERQIFSAWPIESHMTDRTFERLFSGNIQA